MTSGAGRAGREMRGSAGAGRAGWKAWHTVVLLGFVGWTSLAAGRAVLSPLLGAIGREWRLAEPQLGLASSALFLGFVLVQIPTGVLADRIGRKGLLVGGFLVLGLATALRGLAHGFGFFLAASLLAGLAQGTYYPTLFAVSSAAIPQARRAIGSAIIYSGLAVGNSLGFIFGSVAVARWGWDWRTPFLVLAVPIVAVALLFARWLREPPRPASVDSAAAGRLTRGVFTPRLVGVYVANFASLYAFFMLLAWLPYYLEFERGFAGSASGLVASLAPWAALPAGFVVSLVSDSTANRLGPLRFLLPAAAVALAGIAWSGSALALYGFLILYGLVGQSATDPLIVAGVAEITAPERSATAFGFLNFFGMLAAVVAPLVTGFLAHTYGSMRPAFTLSAGLFVVASLALVLLSRTSPRPDPTP